MVWGECNFASFVIASEDRVTETLGAVRPDQDQQIATAVRSHGQGTRRVTGKDAVVASASWCYGKK